MNDIELLALIRMVLCVVALPFAIKGRYVLLVLLLTLGATAAAVTAIGLPRIIPSLIATPLYALLALHTLDITRRRHPQRVSRKP